MYVPHRYRVDDERALDEFVRAHGFALFLTAAGGVPTGSHVPTWNYQAVHLSGPIEPVHDPAELLDMVRRLARHYEPAGTPGGFDVDRLTPRFRAAELRGIVGFRVRVERVEAAFKLSQNRDAADRARVVERLRARGDAGSAAVAQAMAKSEGAS
jgi:transcriptional regulator